MNEGRLLSVRVEGAADVQAKIDRAGQWFSGEKIATAQRVSKTVTDRAIVETRESAATGALIRGFRPLVVAQGRIVRAVPTNVARHAMPVHQGRRPGAKLPPAGALLEWMDIRGIAARYEYVVRRAVARKGIAPLPFFELARKATEARVKKLYRDVLASYADQLPGRKR